MNRFTKRDTAPTRSLYAESLASSRHIRTERRRGLALFVCLLPILALSVWGAVRAFPKLFSL